MKSNRKPRCYVSDMLLFDCAKNNFIWILNEWKYSFFGLDCGNNLLITSGKFKFEFIFAVNILGFILKVSKLMTTLFYNCYLYNYYFTIVICLMIEALDHPTDFELIHTYRHGCDGGITSTVDVMGFTSLFILKVLLREKQFKTREIISICSKKFWA